MNAIVFLSLCIRVCSVYMYIFTRFHTRFQFNGSKSIKARGDAAQHNGATSCDNADDEITPTTTRKTQRRRHIPYIHTLSCLSHTHILDYPTPRTNSRACTVLLGIPQHPEFRPLSIFQSFVTHTCLFLCVCVCVLVGHAARTKRPTTRASWN